MHIKGATLTYEDIFLLVSPQNVSINKRIIGHLLSFLREMMWFGYFKFLYMEVKISITFFEG